MNIFIVLTICLIVSFSAKEIIKKIGLPEVVGQILAGLILGIPIIKILIFTPQTLSSIEFLSKLGILFLLFLAGIEIDLKRLISNLKDSTLIALFSAILPLILGYLFLKLLGYDNITSLIFGIALAVTSEGTKVKVLMDLRVLKTRLGAIMLGAGTIDNIIEVLGLALVMGLSKGLEFQKIAVFPFQILIFGIFCYGLFHLITKFGEKVIKKMNDIEFYISILLLVFSIAAIAEIFEVGFLIGAIIAGFLIQLLIRKLRIEEKGLKQEKEALEGIKLMTLAFLVPFFFINIGLNFDWSLIKLSPWLLIGGVSIAFLGKILGTILTKPFSSLNLRQLYLIGWAMNSRGAVELVIALIAFNLGLIPLEIFSLLVIISLITTLSFSIFLQYQIKKNPAIMN